MNEESKIPNPDFEKNHRTEEQEADGPKTEALPDKGQDRGRLFTQAEVDELFTKRIAKEKAKLEREWKESEEYKQYLRGQDISREMEERLSDLTARNEALLKEAAGYQNREAMRRAGVAEPFWDFVDFEVSKKAGKASFEETLLAFLQENGAFLKSPPPNTGFAQTGENRPATWQAYLDEKYKTNPHYKRNKE